MTMEMIALTREGDTKYTWNPEDPGDLAEAQEVFEQYQKEGFSAFLVKEGGQGEILHDFDPTAGTVLFVPMLAGG